jgi:hypothetical protein
MLADLAEVGHRQEISFREIVKYFKIVMIFYTEKILYFLFYIYKMVKKHMKATDGMYHIHGHKYEKLEGSRAQVWHHTAHQTPGG